MITHCLVCGVKVRTSSYKTKFCKEHRKASMIKAKRKMYERKYTVYKLTQREKERIEKIEPIGIGMAVKFLMQPMGAING